MAGSVSPQIDRQSFVKECRYARNDNHHLVMKALLQNPFRNFHTLFAAIFLLAEECCVHLPYSCFQVYTTFFSSGWDLAPEPLPYE